MSPSLLFFSEVYANEDIDPKVAKLALGLRTAVAKELVVQKQVQFAFTFVTYISMSNTTEGSRAGIERERNHKAS